VTRTFFVPAVLVDTLLTEAVPDTWTVAAELGVDAVDKTPYVTYDVASDGEAGNGPGLYEVSLTINLYDEPANLIANCGILDVIVQSWALGAGAVTGVGVIHQVEDISLLSPARSSAMLAKHMRQATGIYTLFITNH
jgi:hypothetical protein